MLCLVLCALIGYFIEGYHDRWTCALCRSDRTDYVHVGRLWQSTVRESDCTRWYRKHVEPTHRHVWVNARSVAWRNIYGQRFGVLDRDRAGRAIWSLSSDEQLEMYQHFTDPADAQAVFLTLTTPHPSLENPNPDYATVHRLLAWKAAEYTGSWQDAVQKGSHSCR